MASGYDMSDLDLQNNWAGRWTTGPLSHVRKGGENVSGAADCLLQAKSFQ